MSLEQALQDNTAAIKQLIAVISSGQAITQAVAGPAVAAPATEPLKVDKPKAASRKTVAETPAGKPVEGDPEGTRYFRLDKHNTVYKITPTDPLTIIEGSVEISGDDFLARKAELAEQFKSVQTASAPAPAPAPAPAASPTPPAASVPTPASAPTPTWDETLEALKALGKKPGNGRELLLGLLKEFGVSKADATMAALGKNAEIVARAKVLLAQ